MAQMNLAEEAVRTFVALGGLDESQRLIANQVVRPGAQPVLQVEPERLGTVCLGLLLIHGGLTAEQMGIVRAGLSGAAPGNLFTREAAYEFQERAERAGIPCYVRSWHGGDSGYFLIKVDKRDRKAFTRVLEADVVAAEAVAA